MTRSVFILLHLPNEKVIKVANEFQIQKEIDYKQIDPFINEPKDRSNRPIKLNAEILTEDKLGLIYRLVAGLFDAIVKYESQVDEASHEQDSGHLLDFSYQNKARAQKEFRLH